MDNKQLAFFILVFWMTFAVTLFLLGYQNSPNPIGSDSMFTDFTGPDVQQSANRMDALFNPALSNVSLPQDITCDNPLSCALANIAGFFIMMTNIIISLINLIALLLKFLLLFIQTMTLSFGDINFYLQTFIRLLQLLSLIYIATFIRGTK